jgi:sugar phosphate isomerase/epimerase
MTRDDITDRELLELAAKAAGYSFDGTTLRNTSTDFEYNGWNPLDDDGDALRLAVKLKMWTHSGMGCFQNELDPYAATRRAIVHVAAEIGRNMT